MPDRAGALIHEHTHNISIASSHIPDNVLGGHGDKKGVQKWVKDVKSWCKLKEKEDKKK